MVLGWLGIKQINNNNKMSKMMTKVSMLQVNPMMIKKVMIVIQKAITKMRNLAVEAKANKI